MLRAYRKSRDALLPLLSMLLLLSMLQVSAKVCFNSKWHARAGAAKNVALRVQGRGSIGEVVALVPGLRDS